MKRERESEEKLTRGRIEVTLWQIRGKGKKMKQQGGLRCFWVKEEEGEEKAEETEFMCAVHGCSSEGEK